MRELPRTRQKLPRTRQGSAKSIGPIYQRPHQQPEHLSDIPVEEARYAPEVAWTDYQAAEAADL